MLTSTPALPYSGRCRRLSEIRMSSASLLIALVVCLMFQGSICAQVTTQKITETGGDGWVVFLEGQPRVWTAIMDVLKANDLPGQEVDPDAGLITVKNESWASRWGSAKAAVKQLTTKKTGLLSTWKDFSVSGKVVVKPLTADRTEVRIHLLFAACNAWAGVVSNDSCQWQALQSNGSFEAELLRTIAQRIPPLSAESKQSLRGGDQNTVAAAKNVLAALEKVAAAYDTRSADRILSDLIDAQNLFRTFAASRDAKPLRLFTGLASLTLQHYRDALDIDEDVRTASLKKAAASVADATTYLKNYEEFAYEESPGGSPGAMGSRDTGTALSAAKYETPSPIPSDRDTTAESDAAVLRGWWHRTEHANSQAAATGMSVTEDAGHLVIGSVEAGGPAYRAGLRVSDTIMAMDDKPLNSKEMFDREIALREPGSPVRLRVTRNGQAADFYIVIGRSAQK